MNNIPRTPYEAYIAVFNVLASSKEKAFTVVDVIKALKEQKTILSFERVSNFLGSLTVAGYVKREQIKKGARNKLINHYTFLKPIGI